MSTVERLREVQTALRLIGCKLGELATEQKQHPDKSVPGDGNEKVLAWVQIRRGFDKRRAVLKGQLANLEEERAQLQKELSQTPLTRASLGHVIDKLVDIEANFTTDGWQDAWTNLTAFIDWLEREDHRVNVETQVAKLEAGR